MISANNTANTIAIIQGFKPNAFFIEEAMAFDCTPGSNKPTDSTVTSANIIAYILPALPLIPDSM